MEGGFVAVVAAKAFNVEPWVIAVISAAPMFGNLSSFFWTTIATGRSKVPMVDRCRRWCCCAWRRSRSARARRPAPGSC
jgi:hypothetical protein